MAGKRIYKDARTYSVSTSLRKVDITRMDEAADQLGLARSVWMRRALLWALDCGEVKDELTPEQDDAADAPFA